MNPSNTPAVVVVACATPLTGAATAGEPSAQSDDQAMNTPATNIERRNRLGDSTSPYLLQHKGNPVHWWPWGDEAFAAARAQDKPIFLSIGYATCYWCHVMERESFESEEVASIMNEHFVCIKVDREQRPDVDDIYMTAVQGLTGSGGWPMSVFLEPTELKPFLGGTYFPPEDRYGRPGFKSVLRQIAQLWANDRDRVLKQAEQVASFVKQQRSLGDEAKPVAGRQIERALSQLLGAYDPTHGGFGGAPKFPTPVNLDFLIAAGWDREPVRQAVTHTLDRMATGGVYDQIGGGFHRYSVDEKWLVPHFEKMLYDNAQLASTYAEAHARTDDPYYAEIVRETLDYALRELHDEAGGFFSAQDAEVNHREGLNYLWLDDQIERRLRDVGLDDDVDFALEVYGFNRGTNFRDPHHPEDGPKNVVHLIDRPDRLAERMNMTLEQFNHRIDRVNKALLAVRDQREQPTTDDKVLAGWNGLMIAGMADGGRVLGDERFIDAARSAATFVLNRMKTDEGGLLRSYRDGQAGINAFLEDYAYIVHGLLALHRATGEQRWLDEAQRLATITKQRFYDDANGAYFDTLPDQSDLFVRIKAMYDGATPSGNSMMLLNLTRLYERTGDDAYLGDALRTVDALSGTLHDQPLVATKAMQAVLAIVEKRPERLAQPAEPATPGDGPVQVAVPTNDLKLAVDESQRLEITLTIEDGHHINAHEPGLDFLVPLNIELVGAAGVEIQPRYPEGESFGGPAGTMMVHSGTVTVEVVVKRSGDVTGTPAINVTYQACDDRRCFAPQTITLPIAITAR
jgi:hypothetical protein